MFKSLRRSSFRTYVLSVLFLTGVVYFSAVPVTIMEPDAASYADIPMEMIQRNSYHEIFLKGKDWLDKPHFQFWLTALSYKAFGFNNFGYKFPGIIFSCISIYFTFLFGKRFYSIKHGLIAALMVMTAQHFIISVNDVRAEPFLTAFTIISMYYFARYLSEKKYIFLLIGSMGLGCLLMIKGLFTILPVASAIGLSLIYEKKWKEIINFQWIAVVFIILIAAAPALLSYYYQFDMHPEKEIFGKTGVSGIRFFMWDSQWGRFTNTGPIRGQSDRFFFVHTMIWAFAPWAFLTFHSIYDQAKKRVKNISLGENYTFFGFLFTFFVFSVSRFQLPHYLNPLFPFMAIFTTASLLSWSKNKTILKSHFIIMAITIFLFMAIMIILFSVFFASPHSLLYITLFTISSLLVLLILINEKTLIKKILFPAIFITLIIHFALNTLFYPALLKYQSESEVAFYLKKNGLPPEKLVFLDEDQWVTEFYLQRAVPELQISDIGKVDLRDRIIMSSENGLDTLTRMGYPVKILSTFDDFHVTTLNKDFLNRNTRSSTLQKKFLIRLEDQDGAFK